MRTYILILAVLLSFCATCLYSDEEQPPSPTSEEEPAPGVELAKTIAQATGIAVTPLIGVSVVGAWTYFNTPADERELLPWHSSMVFWLPALILGLLIITKEPLLGLIPGAKKPFDALEIFESKVSAVVVATPVVIPMFLETFSNPQTLAFLSPGSHHTFVLAGFPLSDGLVSQFSTTAGSIIFAAVALVGFFIVWMAFHAVNVLIFLSPFGILDTFLRAIKIVFLALIVGSTLIHPYLGLFVCLAILLLCIPVACWSFRLSVFGMILSWDLLSRKHRKIGTPGNRVLAFATGQTARLPNRKTGYLIRSEGDATHFVYRPWGLFRRKNLVVPSGRTQLGRGALCRMFMVIDDDSGKVIMALRLPPRYRGHEDDLCALLGIDAVIDMPLRKGIRALWGWLKEMTGRVTSGVKSVATVSD